LQCVLGILEHVYNTYSCETTTDGEPTTDSNSEPSGSDELHNGTTPQSGTTGEIEFIKVNSYIEG